MKKLDRVPTNTPESSTKSELNSPTIPTLLVVHVDVTLLRSLIYIIGHCTIVNALCRV